MAFKAFGFNGLNCDFASQQAK